MENSTMTRRDRDDLAKLARKQERLLKTAAAERKAVLLADFESQMATEHSYDDATWKAATEAAKRAVEDARISIDERCRELGIPKPFRPEVGFAWYGRGESAVAGRRVELRRVAVTRLDALEKRARTKIEEHSLGIQTRRIAEGLTSEAAKGFLAAMPSVEALMPVLDTSEIRGLIQNRSRPDW